MHSHVKTPMPCAALHLLHEVCLTLMDAQVSQMCACRCSMLKRHQHDEDIQYCALSQQYNLPVTCQKHHYSLNPKCESISTSAENEINEYWVVPMDDTLDFIRQQGVYGIRLNKSQLSAARPDMLALLLMTHLEGHVFSLGKAPEAVQQTSTLFSHGHATAST